MTDVLESLASGVKSAFDRVSDPIIGTFLLTFSITNWRAVLYLFNDKLDVVQKTEMISTYVHRTRNMFGVPRFDWHWYGFTAPIVYTTIYLLLSLWAKNWLLKKYFKIEGRFRQEIDELKVAKSRDELIASQTNKLATLMQEFQSDVVLQIQKASNVGDNENFKKNINGIQNRLKHSYLAVQELGKDSNLKIQDLKIENVANW